MRRLKHLTTSLKMEYHDFMADVELTTFYAHQQVGNASMGLITDPRKGASIGLYLNMRITAAAMHLALVTAVLHLSRVLSS